MQINLKCFATLADAQTCDYKNSSAKTLPEGATVRTLMAQAGIAEKEVKLILINGRSADADTRLQEGDQVALAPALGGM